jgi:hypothetical protein
MAMARRTCFAATWTNNLIFSGAGQYQGVPDGVQKGDPVFVDAANGDYRFQINFPASALGIPPLDFKDVGLRGKGR